jgi:hypothetical protein
MSGNKQACMVRYPLALLVITMVAFAASAQRVYVKPDKSTLDFYEKFFDKAVAQKLAEKSVARRAAAIARAGHTTQKIYDHQGALKSVVIYDERGRVRRLESWTSRGTEPYPDIVQDFDSAGRVIREYHAMGDCGQETITRYDKQGRYLSRYKIEKSDAGSCDTTEFSYARYDSAGAYAILYKHSARLDPSLREDYVEYDEEGRPISIRGTDVRWREVLKTPTAMQKMVDHVWPQALSFTLEGGKITPRETVVARPTERTTFTYTPGGANLREETFLFSYDYFSTNRDTSYSLRTWQYDSTGYNDLEMSIYEQGESIPLLTRTIYDSNGGFLLRLQSFHADDRSQLESVLAMGVDDLAQLEMKDLKVRELQKVRIRYGEQKEILEIHIERPYPPESSSFGHHVFLPDGRLSSSEYRSKRPLLGMRTTRLEYRYNADGLVEEVVRYDGEGNAQTSRHVWE